MNWQAKRILDWGEETGLLGLVQQIQMNDQPLYVLAYHRVDEPERQPLLDPSLLSSTPDLFEQQMALIASKYHPVSAEQVLDAFEKGSALPRDPVLVTVDDGYRDFAEVVFPITQLYGIRPVLFVPTAYVGRGIFWWDQLYRTVQFAPGPVLETESGPLSVRTLSDKRRTLEELRRRLKDLPFEALQRKVNRLAATLPPEIRNADHLTLDWDEMRKLAKAGVTIAAHTHTHPILTRLPLEQARREICESQETLTREIGHALPIFALPDGKPYAFSEEILAMLKEEGFRLNFTMVEGVARLGRDNPLALARLGMSARMSLGQFHLHLTPTYGLRKSLKPHFSTQARA